ncbi:hypothetical protein ABT072_47510 [Streptomyces sp. NPDC002589]|uniref:hypothetical protein n=1 Tax=Streptomyces sp. NPDC002589 TaxID=3154420 RepID=UPI00331C6250
MPATIVLPDRDEIARRIALADPERVAEGLYPGILKLAGRELQGSGVAVSLSLAIADHMKERDYGQTANVMTVLFMKLLPGFVNALVDDEQVRGDALAILEEANNR